MKNYRKLISEAENKADNSISEVLKLGQELIDLTKYSEDFEPSFTDDGLTYVAKDNILEGIPLDTVLEDAKRNQNKKQEKAK